MRHLSTDNCDFLDKLSSDCEQVQRPFEDILSELEEGLESGELTIDDVINAMEQYS